MHNFEPQDAIHQSRFGSQMCMLNDTSGWLFIKVENLFWTRSKYLGTKTIDRISIDICNKANKHGQVEYSEGVVQCTFQFYGNHLP